MPHVDEGQLHAYLDGAYGDASEDARRIARHIEDCAECRARFEEEKRFRTRASDILSAARPLTEAVPPFATVLDRARPARTRWSNLGHLGPGQLGWAASVVLALGIGWFGRDLVSRQEVQQQSAREGAAVTAPPPAASEAVPEPAAAPLVEADRRSAQKQVQAEAPQQRSLDATSGVTGSVSGTAATRQDAVAQTPPPPSVAEQRMQLNAAGAKAIVPAPAPSQPVVAQEMSSVAEVWDSVTIEEAQRRARRPILRIPDLAVTSVAVHRRDTIIVVRVSQRLPAGGVIELTQEPAPPTSPMAAAFADRSRGAAQRAAAPPPARAPAREEVAALQSLVKGQTLLTIGIRGANLTADSLRVLLSRVR